MNKNGEHFVCVMSYVTVFAKTNGWSDTTHYIDPYVTHIDKKTKHQRRQLLVVSYMPSKKTTTTISELLTVST